VSAWDHFRAAAGEQHCSGETLDFVVSSGEPQAASPSSQIQRFSCLAQMMMNNGDSQRQPKSLSIEEQHHEASQDDTGRLQRYLRLAEKMLQTDDGENEDQTNPFHNSQAA
jgi:hypothetical protein